VINQAQKTQITSGVDLSYESEGVRVTQVKLSN